jgi:hypothetical protein
MSQLLLQHFEFPYNTYLFEIGLYDGPSQVWQFDESSSWPQEVAAVVSHPEWTANPAFYFWPTVHGDAHSPAELGQPLGGLLESIVVKNYGDGRYSANFYGTPTPEPSAVLLALCAGAAWVFGSRRRKS